MDVMKKREKEQEMLQIMLRRYCRSHHGTKKELCTECLSLLDYASVRTEKCPFMETKTFCSACKVHCYAPEKREKIRKVMKYAGPRMLIYHPLAAIRHVQVTLSAKMKERKK